MANKRMGEEGLNKRMDEEGVYKRSASEDDVEGHVFKKSAPDDLIKQKAGEDDVEGHRLNKKSAPDDLIKQKAGEDDVEGHMIGTMNPVLARDLARAKEADIRRATSRNNLVSDTKKSDPRKG